MCASAVGATLNNAVFTNAYLNGVDLSDASPQSVDFTGAFLVGVNFTNANLSQDINTGKSTILTGAYLQGATFTNANVGAADFTNAYVDLTSPHGATLLFQLPSSNIAFPGYQPAAGSTLGCVEFTYSHPTVLPATDASNCCPDGNVGPCTNNRWQSPKTPNPQPLPGCSAATADLNWILD